MLRPSRWASVSDGARRTAIRRYDEECAAARDELREARAEAAGSQRRRRAADDLFQRVQDDTAWQWQRLSGQLPARLCPRLGALPRLAEPSRAQATVDHPEQGASD